MARTLHKLSARSVATLSSEGRYSDGGNLYLSIGNGGKRWLFIYRWAGKQREMGLGGLNSVSLAKARERASEARTALADGISPLDAREASQRAAKGIPLFGSFAEELIKDMAPQWRSDTHRDQWTNTITCHASSLCAKRLDQITTEDVLEVLKPIWTQKAETAARLRGRIEKVLDAARAKGFRTGENPARWRGHLDHLLPPRHRLTRGHHAAIKFEDVPKFLRALREKDGASALALEFVVLTAARSGEVLGLTWNEIDLSDKVWNVPAHRMKAGRPHRVPLCDRTVAILKSLAGSKKPSELTGFVFSGPKNGSPLSNMSMSMLMRRMGYTETVHGFRSSFRDWAGEATSFPRELAETALAHVVGDSTERAYRRGDALDKRRKLMIAWEKHCCTHYSDNVTYLNKRERA